jgi:hypothetical protein
MWYADEGLGVSGIGYAVSVDGINWEKSKNNPVLRPGTAGQWDDGIVTVPFVMYKNGKYRMWYMGLPNNQRDYPWQTGFAISDDGISWTKDFDNNPVLSVGAAGQWDKYWAGLFSVFELNDSTYNMLYLGTDFEKYQFGMATLTEMGSDTVTSLESNYPKIPKSVSLYQNYPNPFNPSTTIEFNLPKSEFVELKVFNILGKEVLTLVSNKLNQGNHTYTFDGKNLASGIYYYQLVAGDYREVKKMILLK